MGHCLVSLVGGILSGKGWGNDAWPVVGMVEWRFSGRQMWVVECFGPFPILLVPLLSLHFPYPLDQLSPILPVPLRVPYFPQ